MLQLSSLSSGRPSFREIRYIGSSASENTPSRQVVNIGRRSYRNTAPMPSALSPLLTPERHELLLCVHAVQAVRLIGKAFDPFHERLCIRRVLYGAVTPTYVGVTAKVLRQLQSV